MTIKHILLPLTGEKAGADAAICGLTLAKHLGAHVTAGYEDEWAPLYMTPDLGPSASSYGLFYDQLQQIREERKAVARKHFDHAVATVKLPIVSAPVCQQGSTMWIDDRGGDAPIAAFGPLTDLVVLDSPGEGISFISWRAIEDALFNAHRPTLVVPKGTKSVDFARVLVAWNGSPEAAKAIEHLVDLLPPQAKVTVLQVGDLRPDRLPAEKAIDYLGWHCIETELRRIPDEPKRTAGIILAEARHVGAGCIVMGAYTHSRTREMLLGGVTDHMLRHASCSILLAH